MSNNVFKRTKILATIGPATFSQEKVFQLLDAGVNGIRMNFSHGDNESRLEQINWVRTASQRLGKPVAILQDLQGPKIRLGILKDNMTNPPAHGLRLSGRPTLRRLLRIPPPAPGWFGWR